MNIEVGKIYHIKKFENLPPEFPRCGLSLDPYKDFLCDTIVSVEEKESMKDEDWGVHCKCSSCDPSKEWGFTFYLNEELLEEIPDEKTVKWSGYFAYLKEWMEDHKGVEFYGMSPVSFDEWEGNEYAEA